MRCQELIQALTDESVEVNMNEGVLAVIIVAFGDNTPRAYPECESL